MVALLLAILVLALVPASAGATQRQTAPLPRWGLAGAWARADAPTARSATIRTRRWMNGVLITEYWPVPETWFRGRRLRTPGLTRRARVDWLYSARGVSMEGDGIASTRQRYHIDSLGSAGWINKQGRRTSPGSERLEQRPALVAQRPRSG